MNNIYLSLKNEIIIGRIRIFAYFFILFAKTI